MNVHNLDQNHEHNRLVDMVHSLVVEIQVNLWLIFPMYSVVFVEYIDFAILGMDLARLGRKPLVSENERENREIRLNFKLTYYEKVEWGDEEWRTIQHSNSNAKVTGTWINFVAVQNIIKY